MWHKMHLSGTLQIKEGLAVPVLLLVKYNEHFGILLLFDMCCNVILGTIKDTPTESMRLVLDFPSLQSRQK